MKFGWWDVLWKKVDVTKIDTIIVDYETPNEIGSCDYSDLCRECHNNGYLIEKKINLSSKAYEQFLTSLNVDMRRDVMDLWERVYDGFKGWQACTTDWNFLEYYSINDRSRIELNVNIDGRDYRIFITYKVVKTKSMSTANTSCVLTVIDKEKLPYFGEYGVYYSNMKSFNYDAFNTILSNIRHEDMCFTYNAVGRIEAGGVPIDCILKQYKEATGEDMDISPDSMYVRFATDDMHGYINTIVLHFLRDDSIILSEHSHKVFRTGSNQISAFNLEKALEMATIERTSVGFTMSADCPLIVDILHKLNIKVDSMEPHVKVGKLYTIAGDKTKGADDSVDRNYLIRLSKEEEDKIDITITFLDRRPTVCLMQVFQ